MDTIVWGDCHFNTYGLVRSLGESGHKIFLLTDKKKHNYVTHSKYVKKSFVILNENILDLINEVVDLIGSKPFLFVCGDNQAQYVNSHYDELKQICFLEGGEKNNDINKYRNKDVALSLAKNIGFDIPQNWLIHNADDLPNDLCFPIIIKANNSVNGGKKPQAVCNNFHELVNHLKSLSIDCFPVQAQEFIKKEYEIMIQGCSLQSGDKIIAPIANKKIRFYPTINDAASFSESVLISQEKNLLVLSVKVKEYLKTINYKGLFSAEFVYAKDKFYLLEINLRNDGTSYLSTACGFNLAHLMCLDAEKQDINYDSLNYHKCFFMNLFSDVHHVINREISFSNWIHDVKKTSAFYVINIKDTLPGICEIIYKILNKFRF